MITQFRGEYNWLSNFAPCSIELNGFKYKSVEHAYIAAKSSDIEWWELCSTGNYTAGQLKRVSKDIELV
jgi:hypothetical protein